MSDVTHPPPPTPTPPRHPELRTALDCLATALHLAVLELSYTTKGVGRLPDPRQQLAMVALLRDVGTHIELAAHGVQGLLQLTDDHADKETRA